MNHSPFRHTNTELDTDWDTDADTRVTPTETPMVAPAETPTKALREAWIEEWYVNLHDEDPALHFFVHDGIKPSWTVIYYAPMARDRKDN